ncbi:glycosyltransferase [Laspinema sp. A4]|uniref:glycosyltransferase family 2 protein n=1 Tax=Laspinema sp. D2d TaxID=2953686 RepID=UPI0021BA917C|nr:glycosyltransferase family 2 protein [Laspinema sp. D2d]MCT7983609.1 glycosyltransferase [Laspinema sp. D2d]
MLNPRFSIIVPTRERHDTLFYTLKTCLNQYNFDNYEIIVSDNCSSASTKQVVDSLNSPKIKYFRSDEPLAMSKNWELGVSHASGEYLIVLGDDDGLLFHALYQLDRLLEVLNVKAIRWNRAYYRWPNSPNKPNSLSIPFEQMNHIFSGKKIIKKVCNYKLPYDFLPMLYNSVIHKDLVQLLIEKTGRVFSSQTPDVYSGFVFAYLSGKYASLGIPMSINGGSAKSNGLCFTFLGKNNSITQEFNFLNEKFGYKWHPQVPNLTYIPAVIAESFLQAKDVLYKTDFDLYVNQTLLLENCVKSIQASNEAEWMDSLNYIKESIVDNEILKKWFERKLLKTPYKNQVDVQLIQPYQRLLFNGMIYLDSSSLGVKNVFEAAQICEYIMGFNSNYLEWNNKIKIYKHLFKLIIKNLRTQLFW